MDIAKILKLNEEKAQLLKAVRSAALGEPSKNAALRRITEISQEIRSIEYPPPEPVIDPLDEMSLADLQALYAEQKAAFLAYDPNQYVPGARPLLTHDSRKAAYLSSIERQIQRLEAEEAAAE